MENWVRDAVNHWVIKAIRLNPGCTVDQFENVEALLGLKFPKEFKQLYLTVNGFVDFEWDANMFSIWSLERIVNEFNDSTDKEFVVFCDYFLSVFDLGFQRNKTGVYRNYSLPDAEIELVSNSFKEVIGMINSDSKLLY
jgi:hypothetical protein